MTWLSPTIKVMWGAYFKPDPTDQAAIVTMTRAALGGGAAGGEALITRRIAVEAIAPVFKIENVDAVLEEIEREEASKSDAEREKTTAELHAIASANAGTVRAPGGGKPSGADGVGSGGAGRPAAPKKPAAG